MMMVMLTIVNSSVEIDIEGSSNTIYATIAGTQQATKIDIDGGSNLIAAWTSGTGDLATGRTAIWDSKRCINVCYLDVYHRYEQHSTSQVCWY